mgnify:CR=1 FL=1
MPLSLSPLKIPLPLLRQVKSKIQECSQAEISSLHFASRPSGNVRSLEYRRWSACKCTGSCKWKVCKQPRNDISKTNNSNYHSEYDRKQGQKAFFEAFQEAGNCIQQLVINAERNCIVPPLTPGITFAIPTKTPLIRSTKKFKFSYSFTIILNV